jgi:hypothetical protein
MCLIAYSNILTNTIVPISRGALISIVNAMEFHSVRQYPDEFNKRAIYDFVLDDKKCSILPWYEGDKIVTFCFEYDGKMLSSDEFTQLAESVKKD